METPAPAPRSEAPDTSRHRALSAVSRVRLLNLVEAAAEGTTAASLAEATGLHPSTVREHLDRLTEAGLLTRERRASGSPGRPAWRYRAAPQRHAPPADGPYRALAAALIGHLARSEDDPHGAGVRAGRDWGRALAASLGRQAPMEGLVSVLDMLGFAPRVADRTATGGAVLHLRACPYLDLAKGSPDVVCGVHLGVIGGAMGALGAPGTDADLEPFAASGACVVRVNHQRDPS